MDKRIADEPVDSAGFHELKRRSLAGMGALLVRQVLVKVIFFVGNIVLARILVPQVFGIYAIVSFVVQFFSTFGDVGIGAALIQKKGKLTREELSTVFWLQQLLVWLVVGVVIVAAPLALKVYATLPLIGVWLIRAMAVSFLFSSLKTIPAILMERDIDFKKIAWVDIAENLAFQVVAISCAFMGFEAWSFILAAIARALLGAVIIYALSPWRPTFHYKFEEVRGVLRFGVPYQGNQILSFVKDAVTPLFVGVYAGAAAVGYVNWARNFAFAPLMISEGFGRVAFPAFSKLQDERELLIKAVERSIRVLTLIMCPTTAIMVALGPEITQVVFTEKWMPGLNAYYLFCFTPFLVGITMPMASAILSLGKANLMLLMTLVLIVIEWGIGVPAIIKIGFTGIAITQPISYLLFIMVYWYVLYREQVKISIVPNVVIQVITAAIVGVLMVYTKDIFSLNLMNIIAQVALGYATFSFLVFLLKRNLFVEVRGYLSHMRA